MSKTDPKTTREEPAIQKEGGLTVYLMEELTDARLRCDQLKRYVAEAVKMVNESEKRDHFFEVAGNLLYGIPEALFKLDKALDATALAATRMDYEELKQQLKPEKADELEQVLNEVRIRHINRRSDPAPFAPFKGKTAMRTFKAASQDRIASALQRVAEGVESGEIRPADARNRLRRVLMALSQTAEQAVEAFGPMQADSREKVMEGFKSANPDLSEAELNEIADQWEKNKDVVKEKAAGEEFFIRSRNASGELIYVPAFSPRQADDTKNSEKALESKFEEGKPADPTKNLSPEDAKKWKEEHDKNKDKFKAAADTSGFKV